MKSRLTGKRSLQQFLVSDAGVLDVLQKIEGLRLEESHRGVLCCGKHKATVTVGADDWIHVVQDSTDRLGPRARLARHADVGGNVRFANQGKNRVLLADTRIDGVDHLPASFQEVRDGLRNLQRVRAAPNAEDSPVLEKATVAEALSGLGWRDRVVELEEGWELRPQFVGEAVPVRLRLDGSELVFERGLVDCAEHGDCSAAVALQALRFNAEIRLARLSLVDSQIKVQTRLHGGLLAPSWIADAARAVAAAAKHCGPSLQILRDDQRVARCHVHFFNHS